jgi:hypothetical protein
MSPPGEGRVMLSEYEQKVLQDVEQQLLLEDPLLAQALCLPGDANALRHHLRVRAWLAAACCWLIVGLMVAAGMTQAAVKVLSTGALLALLWRLWHIEARPRHSGRES